ncbi:MAG: hypothetical protein K6B70_02985 [Clostridia bacterium]|nr:hypothetical protein [Clostridia bacterium]
MVENTNIQKLEQQIVAMNVAINEIKNNQLEIKELLHKNHITYMKKLDKLQEFNKILDMTNKVFEKRLAEIEKNVKKKRVEV